MAGLDVHHDGYPTQRRKARFDWSNTPLHWIPGDPFATHLLNMFHLMLPAMERWFIQVLTEAQPLVRDAEVRAAIKPFVHQESWHSWAHQMVLQHLASQGIDTVPYTDRLQNWLSKLGKQHPGWPRLLQRVSLYRRLAVVAALEPFNASLGEWFIQNRGLDYAGADETMLDLLRWHGAEEIEHRSLVFDVYQDVCGSYLLRAVTMISTAPTFAYWWIAGLRFLMANDPTVSAKPRWRDWFRAARQYRVPGPWLVAVTVPTRFIRPGYHPSEEASTQLAVDYLRESPAARAAEAQLAKSEA
jgi:uncharacterized protein